VANASLKPPEKRPLVIVIIAFVVVDDVCLAMFTAATNNGDAPDELVHASS
jgi:hypothetical protein